MKSASTIGSTVRPALRLASICFVFSALAAAQRRAEPFVPIGLSYSNEHSADRARSARDLQTIRALGFNTIRTVVQWAEAEPIRGQYRFDAPDQVLDLAGEAGLKVILQLDTASAPDWLLRRYPDGRFISDSNKSDGLQAGSRICLDHPGVRADVVAFIGAASERGSRHTSGHAVDLGSEPRAGFCICPHTKRRFQEWLKARYGTDARPSAANVADRAAFVALELRDDLKLMADASGPRGPRFVSSHANVPSVIRSVVGGWAGQDDWLMSSVVDHYGTSIDLNRPGSALLWHITLASALDGIRSAAREKGWWMGGLRADQGAAGRRETVSAADLRLWGWTALARGARGLTYAELEFDGVNADRARAAGELAGIITRNPALFAPLRPRPSKIAIVYDPLSYERDASRTFATTRSNSMAGFYRALFERNIPADFIHLDEIVAGLASRYKAIFLGDLATLPPPATEALKAYAAAGGMLIREGEPVTADPDRLVQLAGVTPDVRIDGGRGLVETRYLESSDVIMLIGLNHADTAQRVTMTFTPDTQEAIWQNMETGSAVNFVAGPEGPTYTCSFRPKDALVLMIRRNVR